MYYQSYFISVRFHYSYYEIIIIKLYLATDLMLKILENLPEKFIFVGKNGC